MSANNSFFISIYEKRLIWKLFTMIFPAYEKTARQSMPLT